MWIENTTTGELWDLLPTDPYKTYGGCALLDISGVGYKQSLTQQQVDVDYFVSEIISSNNAISGNLYFNGDEHLENFQNFIGDFRKQFKLYYSPDGEIEPYDRLTPCFYKLFTLTEVKKTEKDSFGWYECPVTLTPQNDVWKRNIVYEISDIGMAGDALVYPYVYPYVYGGRNAIAIEIDNTGRETGCVVKITNNGNSVLSNLEWFVEHNYVDNYNIAQQSVQRAKWYTENTAVTLQNGYTLYVDSNGISQEAKVILSDGTSQSVVDQQEPSWDYINFVRLEHGTNRFVFYVDSGDIGISVTFIEEKEII